METEKTPVVNAAMNYGAMLGLALVAVNLSFYFVGDSLSDFLRIITSVILVLGIILGIKHYRKNELDGFISYGKSLGMGTAISFFSGIIVAFYMYLMVSYFDKTIIPEMLEKTVQEMSEKGIPDEQMELAAKVQEKLFTPLSISFMTVVSNAFMGFIFSLIISIFLKKEKPMFDEPKQ